MKFTLTTDKGTFISVPIEELNRNSILLLESYNFLHILSNSDVPDSYKEYAKELIALFDNAIAQVPQNKPPQPPPGPPTRVIKEGVEIVETKEELPKANNVFRFPKT